MGLTEAHDVVSFCLGISAGALFMWVVWAVGYSKREE